MRFKEGNGLSLWSPSFKLESQCSKKMSKLHYGTSVQSSYLTYIILGLLLEVHLLHFKLKYNDFCLEENNSLTH
jgi:hypothetical protein